jgi:hypothetical protein
VKARSGKAPEIRAVEGGTAEMKGPAEAGPVDSF